MRDYLLMTDSCCDMDPKLAEELGLTVLPLTLDMGGRSDRNYCSSSFHRPDRTAYGF